MERNLTGNPLLGPRCVSQAGERQCGGRLAVGCHYYIMVHHEYTECMHCAETACCNVHCYGSCLAAFLLHVCISVAGIVLHTLLQTSTSRAALFSSATRRGEEYCAFCPCPPAVRWLVCSLKPSQPYRVASGLNLPTVCTQALQVQVQIRLSDRGFVHFLAGIAQCGKRGGGKSFFLNNNKHTIIILKNKTKNTHTYRE